MTKAEMDQLIDRMDLNQDGNIAFDEFSSALVDWQKVGLSHALMCALLREVCLIWMYISMMRGLHCTITRVATAQTADTTFFFISAIH